MKVRMTTLFMAILCSMASADVIHVPADFPTIQIAIQEAAQGDIIILAQDTYYEAISFGGKRLTIQSEDPLDPAIVDATIIDAMGLGSVVTFLGSEDSGAKLYGITVQGGDIGIDGNQAECVIENCHIRDNNDFGIYDVFGEVQNCVIHDNGDYGFHAENSPESLTINHCEISNNDAGILLHKGSISDCLIVDNSGDGIRAEANRNDGIIRISNCQINGNRWGIYASYNGKSNSIEITDSQVSHNVIDGINTHPSFTTGIISRCFITGNHKHGIYGFNRNSLVENCIISGNKNTGVDTSHASILNCTVSENATGFSYCDGTIRHCIIWANDDALVNSSTPEISGTVNPLFIQPGNWSTLQNRWIEGDYHLMPDSPYIDAGDPFYGDPGDPTLDADSLPRVIGTRIDIGAYEYNQDCEGPDFDGDGTPDPCDRDTDNDGITNSFDPCDYTLPTFTIDETGRPRADLNRDCVVNLADFAIMQKDFEE